MHETHESLEKESYNNFQPSGRNRPYMGDTEAVQKENGYICYHEDTSKKIIERDYGEEIKKPTTANFHGKKAV